MRFCRDAHLEPGREPSHDDYVYGGTEEELIAKGEWLCEGLSRLYVPLCEVAGIPGRILYHVIGGHVTAEVFVGAWAYVDPRMGVYFRKARRRLGLGVGPDERPRRSWRTSPTT